jgi:type I restriction enzyme M protein
MITGTLRNQIDKLWTEFWTGGIANPLTVIEQISFLMFSRLLDIAETRAEKRASRLGKPFKGQFSAKDQKLRWSHFKNLPAEQMLKTIRDEVFPHFRNLGDSDSTFAEYMTDAQLMVQKPSLLVSAVNMIDALPLTEGDTKGDLYEYLLGKLTTAGINGQFRTPRHIIRLMVDLIEPKPTEIIGDPACGTAGFLVAVMQHLLEKHTSPQGVITHEDGQKTYTGDLLEPYRKHIQTQLFHGYDFDATMLRIAAMNLMLHGVESPDIHYQDTLSNSFPEKYPKRATDGFDVILANPPFKGSLDEADVHSSITGKVKTKKTELLFVALILRMLKLGGRAAIIVPDGVLFGSSNAHKSLRQLLVDENQLEAVIALPAGVFKPYAGVSTAIVIFTKGGKTDRVWFYKMESDGFSLDDKREQIGDGTGDLPDIREKWFAREKTKKSDRKAKNFFVPVKEIRDNKYDLSISRYRETEYEEARFDPPQEIIKRLRTLDKEVNSDMDGLEALLK